MSKRFQCQYCQSTWEVANNDNEREGKPLIVNISTCTSCIINIMERLQSEVKSKSKYSDINKTAENLIAYIQWERTTHSNNGEVIKPTRKFALQILIDTYSKINTEKELTQVFKQKLASEEFEI
jgi:hypothetical protein